MIASGNQSTPFQIHKNPFIDSIFLRKWFSNPVFFRACYLKNPPNCVKNFLWKHQSTTLKKKRNLPLGLMFKKQITQSQPPTLETLRSVTYSFGVGSVKANELTDARGIVACTADTRFRVSVKSKKVALKKKKRGGNNHLQNLLEPFFSFCSGYVQGCFCDYVRKHVKWGQQLGRYTQTDSVKTYRLNSANPGGNFTKRLLCERHP